MRTRSRTATRSGWRTLLSPGAGARVPEVSLPGVERISARHLTVTSGHTVLLDDVDVRVLAGEVLVVVGPNGAGKSTLLAALAGDIPNGAHREGDVLLGGRPIEDWSAVEQAMRRAVLPQAHTVGFGFDARDVVAMGRAPWRDHLGDDDDAVVADAMARTETTHLAHRDVTSLSGGERARVAFARCLAQATGVLLLDEPIAALDLRHQVALLDQVDAAAKAGAGVVVVMHDLGLAARIATKVLVLADGRVRAVGTPSEVFTEALLAEVYGCAVDVFGSPRDGSPVILPATDRRSDVVRS
ncbi:MAG: heme ABC transporter ATP-binding protein [Microthrixaceae bacterium]